MGLITTILVIILIIVILSWIISYMNSNSAQLTSVQNGNEEQTISASSLPSNSNTSNYTYSTWFYVTDWNYRFGEPKVLLARLDQDNVPSPSIVLGAMENNITISVSCYPTVGNSGTTLNDHIIHKCEVRNFPLQKWVNLIISLNGQTLDVYIDGKLFRTCVLPGVAKINSTANVIVTPDGGFAGYTGNFRYWANPSNPQQAYNIYKSGYGGTGFGNFFEQYRIRVQFLDNNQVEGSFEI